MTKNKFLIFALLLFLLAAFFRVYEISARPFHSDEGVNYFFLKQIAEKGYYPYSYENYHGPSFFYSAYLAVKVFGHNDFGMRFASIFYGMLCIVILLLISKSQGRVFSILALALFSVSSSLIFHSRYAIHETLFVFSTLWLFFHSYLWCETHQKKHLYGFFLAIAALIATKETFVINLFCLVVAGLFFGDFKKHLRALEAQKTHLQYAFLLSLTILFGLFSGGFKWFRGIKEMFMAVQQWVGRGVESDVGHFKPFDYYLVSVILEAEPHLVVPLFMAFLVVFSCLLALLFKIFNKNNLLLTSYTSYVFSDRMRFLRVLSAWAVSAFLVYSFVPYKTVWLVINMTLPLLLVFAALFDLAFRKESLVSRLISGVLLIVILASSTFHALKYNFKVPYGPKNPYSYVHTSPGMLEMIGDIEDYWQNSPKASVLIGVNSYWPLPYYFRVRKQGIGYLKTEKPWDYKDEYQVIIVNYTINWDEPGWEKKYYRLSDVQEANVYFRK